MLVNLLDVLDESQISHYSYLPVIQVLISCILYLKTFISINDYTHKCIQHDPLASGSKGNAVKHTAANSTCDK